MLDPDVAVLCEEDDVEDMLIVVGGAEDVLVYPPGPIGPIGPAIEV